MIRIDNLEIYGIESATLGMRNPMNSWHLNDTKGVILGENDKKLLLKLCKAGADHRKVLRQMFISYNVTAPIYWYKEMDQYKVGVTSNSQSTMHKLCSRPLTVHDFSFEDMHDQEWIVGVLLDNLNSRIRDYKADQKQNKALWRTIIQLLPCAYNQTRTYTLNYEVALNIYTQRKNHKLSEWREFCQYLYDNLPYFDEIVNAVGVYKKLSK
nr:MAG TPA: hypothetical protein [Caudoviricetes sp.]